MVGEHLYHETPPYGGKRVMKVYMAGPLFTEAERQWNDRVCALLEAQGHEVFLPQRDSPQADLDDPDWQQATFEADVRALRETDVVLANLNGPQADDGTAWECGMAFALDIRIVAYRDDWRQAGDDGRGNLMLTRSAEHVAGTVEDALVYLERMTRRLEADMALWRSTRAAEDDVVVKMPPKSETLSARGRLT